MKKVKYLIASNAAYDRISFPDGRETGYLPGGAGLHALTGIQLWTDDVLLVCGIGADWKEKIGSWVERNHIDTSAFDVRDELTPLNSCTYTPSGERIDRTVYGDAHYNSLDCQGYDLERFFADGEAEAIYTFRDDQKDYWETMEKLQKEHGFRLMWEINARICVPEKLDEIRRLLSFCSTFSINRAEAFSLFGTDSEEEAIGCLRDLGMEMTLFRTGAKGLYVILPENVKFFPSIEKDSSRVIDVTGCGNSSTAASFWAWNEGYGIDGIGHAANIASYRCLKEYSAMNIGEEARQEAFALLQDLCNGGKE